MVKTSTLAGALKICSRGKNPSTVLEMTVENKRGDETKVRIVIPGLWETRDDALERLAKTPAVKISIGSIDDGTGKIAWRDTRAPGVDAASIYCHHMAVDTPPDSISQDEYESAVTRFSYLES
jgi:hypothetical protein